MEKISRFVNDDYNIVVGMSADPKCEKYLIGMKEMSKRIEESGIIELLEKDIKD